MPLQHIAWFLLIKMSIVILVPSLDTFFELSSDQSLSLYHGDKEGESEEKEWFDPYFSSNPPSKTCIDETEVTHSFTILNRYPSVVLERMVPPPESHFEF